MSGCRVRRTIVLALVLTAGLLPATSAGAAQTFRADRAATIRQESVLRTLMGNVWSQLQSVLGKDQHPGNGNQNDPPKPEGPAICPLGRCGN